MSKSKTSDYDDGDYADLLSDPDLDAEKFVDAMEEKRNYSRQSWKRVEELRDSKWLRAQLADWEDFDTDLD